MCRTSRALRVLETSHPPSWYLPAQDWLPGVLEPADEVVRPQDGGFYGGWVTDDVVGPFKGATGTLGW